MWSQEVTSHNIWVFHFQNRNFTLCDLHEENAKRPVHPIHEENASSTAAYPFSPDSAGWTTECSNVARSCPPYSWISTSSCFRPNHHYGKPRGPSSAPGRYPPGGNPSAGYNHSNRGGPGGGVLVMAVDHILHKWEGHLMCLVGIQDPAVAMELELQTILKVVPHMVDWLLVVGQTWW
jgi:hypothetical protein